MYLTLLPVPAITNFGKQLLVYKTKKIFIHALIGIAGGFSLGPGLQDAYLSANLDIASPSKNSFYFTAKKVDLGVLICK